MAPRDTARAVRLTGSMRWPLALGSGLLMASAFPPVGWWWTALLSVALSTVATFGASLRFAAALGLLAGMGFFAPLLSWMTVVGVDAWIALSLLCASWWALLFVAQALVQRLRAWPVLVPAVWVASEALRGSQPLGGFPWGRLAFAQVDGPLLYAAGIVGAAGLALCGGRGRRHEPGTAPSWCESSRSPGGDWSCLRLQSSWWCCRPSRHRVSRHPSRRGRDAPGRPSSRGARPERGLSAMGERRAVLAGHVTQTRRLVGGGARPDVVIWPENSQRHRSVRRCAGVRGHHRRRASGRCPGSRWRRRGCR